MVSLIVLPICHLAMTSLLLICFAIFQSVSLISPLYLQNSSGKPCFHLFPIHRGIISKLYDIILAFSNHSNAKCTWERELGIQIHEESWEQAIERIRSTTSCARLGLIQFKILYRAHFSKSRLSELYPEVEDKCDKCHGSPCHLSHMFFLCPDLKGFWVGYFTIMSSVLGGKSPTLPSDCYIRDS